MTQASEYGGVPGTIQPEPHSLTAIEEARLMRRVNPEDAGDSIEAARERETKGEPDGWTRGAPTV
jgi:hypothetical protein